MGIKLAKALGNDVMAISTSANKEQLAKEKGATMFACSKDPESMKAHAGKCDLILNTSMLTFIITFTYCLKILMHISSFCKS